MFWTPLRHRTILPSQPGILRGTKDDSPIFPRRYERDENDDQEPIDTTPTTTTTGSPMMKCETPSGISYRPSLIENENDPRTVQDPSWYRDDLSSLVYIELGFRTPTSTTTTKIFCKPHRRQSVLIDSTQRPAWNSPDAMDVEWEDNDVNNNDIDVLSQHHLRHDQEETVTTRMALSLPQREPPPPPSPSRRICFVSLDNFTPTPVFGVNFPALSPPSRSKEKNKKIPFHQSKRLKLCLLDDDDDENNNSTMVRPKLTMKRTRYQEARLEGKGSTSFIPIPSYPSTLRWWEAYRFFVPVVMVTKESIFLLFLILGFTIFSLVRIMNEETRNERQNKTNYIFSPERNPFSMEAPPALETLSTLARGRMTWNHYGFFTFSKVMIKTGMIFYNHFGWWRNECEWPSNRSCHVDICSNCRDWFIQR